jgi:large subunit ribosomal protein L6
MSRIGKLPINIPEKVEVNCTESDITVKKKFGTLQTKVPEVIFITQDGSQLKVIIKEQTRNVRALHGLYRTLINNMVVGVSEQFDLTLH